MFLRTTNNLHFNCCFFFSNKQYSFWPVWREPCGVKLVDYKPAFRYILIFLFNVFYTFFLFVFFRVYRFLKHMISVQWLRKRFKIIVNDLKLLFNKHVIDETVRVINEIVLRFAPHHCMSKPYTSRVTVVHRKNWC